MLPLYEAKMVHIYDTRWATYEPDGSTRLMTESEKVNRVVPLPRYWIAEGEVSRKLSGVAENAQMLCWRDICRATDERTLIASRVPTVGLGNKLPVMVPTVRPADLLQIAMSSFVCDFAGRQKLGGTTFNFFILAQLPVPAPRREIRALSLGASVGSWLGVRVDRLNGWIADPVERSQVRAELDAYCFHLYGLARDEVEYVMDQFPIVRKKDEAECGEYRTKRLILTAYDAMAQAIASGATYTNPFTEVPA